MRLLCFFEWQKLQQNETKLYQKTFTSAKVKQNQCFLTQTYKQILKKLFSAEKHSAVQLSRLHCMVMYCSLLQCSTPVIKQPIDMLFPILASTDGATYPNEFILI